MRDVLLREVVESDLPLLFEHQRDPDGTRMAAFPARDREAFDAHWAKILADPNAFVRTVVADGEIAGNIVSWDQDGKRLIGYWIGKDFWGRGIATAALAAFVEILQTRPLHAYVAEHNVASIHVLQKCGFKIVAEEQGVPFDGRPVKDLLFELPASNVEFDADRPRGSA